MSEIGPSVSEIRPTDQPDKPTPEPGHEPPPQPGNQPQKRSGWTERARSLLLNFLSEEPFRAEDYTERAVARSMIQLATHPSRERLGHLPSEYRFTKRDFLADTGHMLDRDNPNSPAYKSIGQAFNALVRDGRIKAVQFEEPQHGELQGYYIDDEAVEQLKQFSESPEEE